MFGCYGLSLGPVSSGVSAFPFRSYHRRPTVAGPSAEPTGRPGRLSMRRRCAVALQACWGGAGFALEEGSAVGFGGSGIPFALGSDTPLSLAGRPANRAEAEA